MKTRRRTLIIGLALIVLLASAGLVAAMVIPSAQELLVDALEALETVADGHAVVTATAQLPDQEISGAFEVWGKLDMGPNGEPAFRLEVLRASRLELEGLVAVTDGDQFWLYSPDRNTVVVGRGSELAPILADRLAPLLAEKLAEHEGQLGDSDPFGGDFDPETAGYPETPEEAVARLLEYFTAERDGMVDVAAGDAYRLRLVPIAEQMPDEVRAAGGFINLWLRSGDHLPLAAEYAQGALGYAKIEATSLQVNSGLADDIFTFDIPEGAVVIEAADLLAEAEQTAEADAGGDFELLQPATLPEGANTTDGSWIAGAYVQRFSLPGGGSFVLAQGASMPLDPPAGATSSDEVTVRGAKATLFTDDEGGRTLLAWREGELFFVIGGDLTPEQAMSIAQSLQ